MYSAHVYNDIYILLFEGENTKRHLTTERYFPDYKYEEGSSEIACESSAHIYDVIL